MLKSLSISLLTVALGLGTASAANACGGCYGAYAPACPPAVIAPAPAPAAAAAIPVAPDSRTATAPGATRTYRSFSYEPGAPEAQGIVEPSPRPAYQRSFRSYRSGARKDPWMYPKTDPRRYGG